MPKTSRFLQGKLPAAAEVAECDAALPGHLFTHAREAVQRRKAARFRADVARLIQKLSDILAADFARSDAGHSAEALRAGIGDPQAQAFDFAAMSRMLASISPPSLLPELAPRAHPLATVCLAVAAVFSRAASGRCAAAGAAGV